MKHFHKIISQCLILRVDQIPWNWVEFPCEASPPGTVQGCWNQCLGEEGETTWLDPAEQMAKEACPSPTQLGLPILSSDHEPEVSQHIKNKLNSLLVISKPDKNTFLDFQSQSFYDLFLRYCINKQIQWGLMTRDHMANMNMTLSILFLSKLWANSASNHPQTVKQSEQSANNSHAF